MDVFYSPFFLNFPNLSEFFCVHILTQLNLEIMGLGGSELILIGVVVLLLFGGKKLPELMRGLGKGINEFKNAKDGDQTKTDEPQPVTVPVSEKPL